MRDAKAHLGIRDEMPPRPAPTYKRPARPQCGKPKSRVLKWLLGRGLTEETIAAFKIGEQERGGKTYAVFPYLRDGELVNAKRRNPDEKKDMLQEGGAEPCLFGWHLIEPNARRVAIFEGEIDAMTGHQMGIASLSINAGRAIINGSRTTGNACSSSATSCCATTATKRARRARAR